MKAEIENRSGAMTLTINDGYQVLLTLLESAHGKQLRIVDETGQRLGSLEFRSPMKESHLEIGKSKCSKCSRTKV